MSNLCPKCQRITDSRNGGLCLDCYFEVNGWKVDISNGVVMERNTCGFQESNFASSNLAHPTKNKKEDDK